MPVHTERDTGFSGPVRLRQSGDVDWCLTEDLTYEPLTGEAIVVPGGFTTDGASVPRVVSWLVPRSGRYLPAAVLHDHCYRTRIPDGLTTYREADALFLEAMRRLGVPALLRWAIWASVRLAGLFRRGGRSGWWRDAIPVAVVTIPALLVVTVPAVLVAVALAVWALLEVIVFVALWLFGRTDRYVNLPTADLAVSD